LKAERRIISKRCMVVYILLGTSGLPLNSVWGTNSGRKLRGGKGVKRFSVHFNLHKPIQIVFFKNFENCTVGPLSKMKPCTRRVPKIGKKH